MFLTENREAALEAARRAHHYHFGMTHDHFIVQDQPNIDMTLSTPINMRPPRTYTVEIALLGPPPTSSEENRIATALPGPSPRLTTEITFVFWLPWIMPLDSESPDPCFAPGCPLAHLFHFEGVFVVERDRLDASPRFRNAYSPSDIWEAQTRVDNECPTDEDLNITEAFDRHHYWYNLRKEYPYRLLHNFGHLREYSNE